VSGAIRQGHWLVAAAMLALLAIIFVGIAGMLSQDHFRHWHSNDD